MRYVKPEVQVVASAASVIQGAKGESSTPDNPIEHTYSVAAYAADE